MQTFDCQIDSSNLTQSLAQLNDLLKLTNKATLQLTISEILVELKGIVKQVTIK